MLHLYLWIKSWLQREEGQDLIEYGLLLALIAIICIVAITAAGEAISGFWNTISTTLTGL
ncbi:MAG TPA: Flp family type IVb pilin [Anaerolineae bacterium]|nr:Flp family type IVb pilin [Anaerolineae bacterium]